MPRVRQYNAIRREALAWLVAHPDEAYPKLRAIADTEQPPSLALEALLPFKRADSVPVLERALLRAEDFLTVDAALVLAKHPAPTARTALERALLVPRDQTVASAAAGLGERGDRASCAALAAARTHRTAEVVARLRAAAGQIGCPTP